MADPPDSIWLIQKLGPDHERSHFDCGQTPLNDFLRRYASQNERAGFSRTYVAVRRGEQRVAGYYALAAGSTACTHIPESLRKRLPRYPVPVAHLGQLAVDEASQGMGLGELLLMDAFARIAEIANAIGIHAVDLWAMNDRARRFYLRYGFMELLDDPSHLYVPIQTLRKLRLI
jgi:ribosomal protein S18 acetylase RimI-like enzyme